MLMREIGYHSMQLYSNYDEFPSLSHHRERVLLGKRQAEKTTASDMINLKRKVGKSMSKTFYREDVIIRAPETTAQKKSQNKELFISASDFFLCKLNRQAKL